MHRNVIYLKKILTKIVIQIWNKNWDFFSKKSMRKWNRTLQALKCIARTHIASYIQNGFRTHIATYELRPHIHKSCFVVDPPAS